MDHRLNQSDNELGLSKTDVAAFPQDELKSRLHGIEQRFKAAGTHNITEGIWNCAPILESNNQHLTGGEKHVYSLYGTSEIPSYAGI